MANQLIPWSQVLAEMDRVLLETRAGLDALAMFIEGQYNWERREFDDHG